MRFLSDGRWSMVDWQVIDGRWWITGWQVYDKRCQSAGHACYVVAHAVDTCVHRLSAVRCHPMFCSQPYRRDHGAPAWGRAGSRESKGAVHKLVQPGTMGSTSDSVKARCKCPCLIVRPAVRPHTLTRASHGLQSTHSVKPPAK